MAEDKDKKRKEIRERLEKSKKSGGIDRSINRLTVSSPGGDPTNRNKDGSIKRTKQIRKEFSTKEGVLPKKRVVKKTTVTADPAKKTPKKSAPKGQAEKGASPLAGKPRSIAEAKRRGEVYFFDSKGVKKIAATAADLKRTGLTLRQYANKFAPKKQTKKHAESLKGFAAIKKKRAGGMMKKKGMARGGMMMKKKGMAKGGKLKMVMKDGKKVPFFAADGKGKMRGGGMMKKKGYAMGGAMKKKGMAKGGAMKKKGYKKGGKVLKMRGGGLATRGTSFTIK
jgi:hypothetical protein|tara:strand:- start:122 stop:964 length:843 start_codon:yes stop_codon:yes gene_type:complete